MPEEKLSADGRNRPTAPKLSASSAEARAAENFREFRVAQTVERLARSRPVGDLPGGDGAAEPWVAAENRRGPGLVILCPRFEGVDERVIEGRGLIEVSIGDYVLSGGEIAALAVLDACVRLIPGVMGKAELGAEREFRVPACSNIPTLRGPREWEGRTIPEVLLSGDHARIAALAAGGGRADHAREKAGSEAAGRILITV